jgi:hypothetical protein
MRCFATTVGEFSLRIPHTHALFRDSFSIVRSSERAHGVYTHTAPYPSASRPAGSSRPPRWLPGRMTVPPWNKTVLFF